MSAIDIDFLKTWEGKTETLDDELSPFKARALAAVLNRKNLPVTGETLSPGWQWLYFLHTPSSEGTGADGHPCTGDFLPPSPLPRRMWAAGNVRTIEPLVLAERATKLSRISSVDLKSGKSGTLLFVNVLHEITQRGELCISEEQNIVYREMPTAPAPLPAGVQPDCDAEWCREVRPDPVLLFRFSALTYNSHRIHYDRDYAVDEEFYPALVVHGPLLATLLVEHAVSRFPDEAITGFKFRAQRPTFDNHPFTLCGRREGNILHLWTQDHEGFIGMTATAEMGQIS